ncbi:hypothetical protein [Helicobacter rodentium]|nr:hypothetical protein [Helicobacter rodentium]
MESFKKCIVDRLPRDSSKSLAMTEWLALSSFHNMDLQVWA